MRYLLEHHRYLWLHIVSMVSCWWCDIWSPSHQWSVCRVTHLSPGHTFTHFNVSLFFFFLLFFMDLQTRLLLYPLFPPFFCKYCFDSFKMQDGGEPCPAFVCVRICVCECSPSPFQQCERGRTVCWGSGCIRLSGPGWSAPGPLLPPSPPQGYCSLDGPARLFPPAAAKPDIGPAGTHSSSNTHGHTDTH